MTEKNRQRETVRNREREGKKKETEFSLLPVYASPKS